MFGLTTTRRLRAELDAAKAETARQRERADRATDRASTAEYNRGQVLRQNAELDAANRRLADRNLELGRRLSQHTEADPQYAAQLEQRVERLKQVGVRILAAWHAEQRRADRLQQRLDDAVGLKPGLIRDSGSWQPANQPAKEAS
ncbi:hypothetical protein ACH4UY_04715 [Streptomyces longwoodensis]|uniref:hypothetical protein n=1 Tax=Streptomyces longwoodensis TaxID=68231 RepID=UPI0037B54B66